MGEGHDRRTSSVQLTQPSSCSMVAMFMLHLLGRIGHGWGSGREGGGNGREVAEERAAAIAGVGSHCKLLHAFKVELPGASLVQTQSCC